MLYKFNAINICIQIKHIYIFYGDFLQVKDFTGYVLKL